LAIGAEFDTMDPEAMKTIAENVQKGSYLFCHNAGHMAMFDAPDTYYPGIISFVKGL